MRLTKELAGLTEGVAFAFPPPAIPGAGTSGGFTFALEDRSGKDIGFLAQNVGKFVEAARKRPEIGGIIPAFLPAVPQVFVDVDRDKVLKQGINLNQVYQTLQTFMGGYFVNYFNRFGRTWQVYVEAEGDYRTDAKNVREFYVRNSNNDPVPLDAIATIKNIAGPEFTLRYNEYRAAQIIGGAAPGYSSAQAMKALEETFRETMPPGMGYDYMGMSFQEKKAQQGVSPLAIFALSIAIRVPDSRRALRELVAAVQRVVRHADRRVRRVPHALVARNGKQHLCADRLGHAHRSRREKCHSDCRIRQGRIRKRQTAARCRARRRAVALAPDPDDFFSLHLRASAVVVRQRFRRCGSSDPGLDRYRRNDRRVRDRDLSDSGNVLCG